MSEIQAVTPQKAPLKLGAERMDVVTRLLKDKQVGLVVNQTSILEKQQKHLLDALLEEPDMLLLLWRSENRCCMLCS